MFIRLLTLIACLSPLVVAQNAAQPASEVVRRHVTGADGPVELQKTLDPETGRLRVSARSLDGRILDPSELRAEARRLPLDPQEKIHPRLRADLQRDGAGVRPIDLWLRFRPAELEQAAEAQRLRAGGVPETELRLVLREQVVRRNLEVVEPVEHALRARGITVVHADALAPLIVCRADREQILELALDARIARIFPSVEAGVSLDSAAATHRWDRVFDFGIRGDGVRLAVVEPGRIDTGGTSINVVATHLPGAAISGHATAVAAVAGSDDPTWPGYARGVEVLNANGASGSLADFATATAWATTQGAAVLNTSANIDDASLVLTAWDFYVDYVVRYLRVSFTVSAANAGLGSGSVKSPGLAWNVITVGAADDAGNADWDDDTMANYSSWHDPLSTHGDREKPELVAIGSNLNVVGAGGVPTVVSGTSFAAPSMAGIAASLLQAAPELSTDPEAMKAVLMAAATHNIEGASRLSDKDGAGCINGLQALRILEQRQFAFGTFLPGSFGTNGYWTQDVFLQGGDLTRAVICWDSDAAYTTDLLDADLDLVIRQGAGNTTGPTLAGSVSFDNSYEIIEFCPPATGWYTLGVSAYAFAGATEPFGLAWTQQADGRYARFRPRYPDALANDASGPTIGNPAFLLAPLDGVNPFHGYIAIASGSDLAGFALPGCRRLLQDVDIVSELSLMPGNGYFFDFQGTLDGIGEAPTLRMAVPDAPFLAGYPLHFGLVTVDPLATGGVKEVAVKETVTLWDHAVDLGLGDDGSQAVNLGFSFPFFGASYAIAYVNANGNITFTGPDSTYQESVSAFLGGLERIAPFWDDLDPSTAGSVRARFAGDRFVVEWVDVPQYNHADQNSVFVVLHQSGVIEFKYRDCALSDALVGITPGGGTTAYPLDLTHGSRAPDSLLYIFPPAMYEEFTGPVQPFDLGSPTDVRITLTFTPTGLATGNYRMTVDLDT